MVRLDSTGPRVSSRSEFDYVQILDLINAELSREKRLDELVRFAPELVELMRDWFREIKYVSNTKGTFELLRNEFKLVESKLRRFEASLANITPLHRAIYVHFLASVYAGPDMASSEKYAALHPDIEPVYPDEFYTPLTDARDQCFLRGTLEDFENYLAVFEERFSTDLAVFALSERSGVNRRAHEARAAKLKLRTDELEAGLLLAAVELPIA